MTENDVAPITNAMHLNSGHHDTIVSLQFSPDGSRLLTGSWDGFAKLWNVVDGKLLRTFSWGASGIHAVSWSPDGTHIALSGSSRSTDELTAEECESYQRYFSHNDPSFIRAKDRSPELPPQVRIFNAETGELIHIIDTHYRAGVAFSPSGSHIAISNLTGPEIYDWKTKSLVASYCDESLRLRNVFYSIDGKQLACICGDGAWVFDSSNCDLICLATTQEIPDAPCPAQELGGSVVRVEKPVKEHWSPFFEEDRIVKLWLEALTEFRPTWVQDDGVGDQRIVFSPSNNQVALVHTDFNDWAARPVVQKHGIAVGSLSEPGSWRLFESPGSKWIRTASFSPDGHHLATAGDHKSILVWDMASDELVCEIGVPPPSICSMQLSPNQSIGVVGTSDGTTWVFDNRRRQIIECRDLHPPVDDPKRLNSCAIASIQLTPDSQHLVAVSKDGSATFLSTPSLSCVSRWQVKEPYLGGAVTSDGTRFVTVGSEQNSQAITTVSEWLLETGECLSVSTIQNLTKIRAVATSPDYRTMAMISSENLWLINLSDMSVQKTPLQGQSGRGVHRIDFTPDSTHLIVGYEGYCVEIICLEFGTVHQELVATRDDPTMHSLNKDGIAIARVTAYHKEIELFNKETGQLYRFLNGHQDSVRYVSFCSDGREILSGGSDGTIKWWNAASGQLLSSLLLLPSTNHSGVRWESINLDDDK